MPSPFYILLCITSLFSYSWTLNLPSDVKRATGPRPNPLPPPPPPKPIGPDNFRIPGTDLTIKVDRPWGQPLPHDQTILCLASAQSALDQRIAAQGDIESPLQSIFEERGIRLLVLRLHREEFHLSAAKVLLRGVVELMIQYPELGTRAMGAVLSEPGNIIGRVEISRYQPSLEGTRTSVFNSSTNLTALNPKNYRVPHTAVTISLDGEPPYGSPLPRDLLILALAEAQAAAGRMVQEAGDDAVPSAWRFEEGMIGIHIVTDLRIDCKYSVLQTALLGLVDLILEPGGVGAVSAYFYVNEDGKGTVASGNLKMLRASESNGVPASRASAVLIEQRTSTSHTLVGGAVQTGQVGIA